MQEITTLNQQLVQLLELGLVTGIIPILFTVAILHILDHWGSKK